MIEQIKEHFEKRAYGVCAWWGERLNVNTNSIRVYFIYASFLTLGSPLIIYLIMAFILRNKYWFKARRSTIWEL